MPHRSEHFLDFIKSLEGVLAGYEKNSVEFQRGQVEGLLAAERAFREALIRHPHGAKVYRAFVNHIMVEKRNLLMARPYFRERDKTFKAHIAHILRKAAEPKEQEHHRRLYRFDINYQFIAFAMKVRAWAKDPQSRKVMRLAHEALRLRNSLVECNLPLAIFYARKFHARNRASHHDFMDFLQVASGGLAAGVDKYVGPYTVTFRSVLIGRIVGDLIEANSETFVHFFPPDKRRLYRIRKIAASLREGLANIDYALLAKLLNKEERAKGEAVTNPKELHHLVNASSLVSASSLPVGEEEDEHQGSPIERYADEAENRPDMLLEEAQTRRNVAQAITALPVIEQKLLRLRGVDLSMLA